MRKSIAFGIVICLLTWFVTQSFKSADNEKKDYITIYYNNIVSEISLSYSNGTFTTIKYQKSQGPGDQTQLLKIINEQESLGYKLIYYDYKTPFDVSKQVTTVLLSK